jgi:hypothetical protein
MPVFEILRGTMAGFGDTWKKGDAYQEIVGQTGFGGFGFGSDPADQAAYMNRIYQSRELSWNQWQKYPNAFGRLFDKLEGGALAALGAGCASAVPPRRATADRARMDVRIIACVSTDSHGIAPPVADRRRRCLFNVQGNISRGTHAGTAPVHARFSLAQGFWRLTRAALKPPGPPWRDASAIPLLHR